jgi:hypothetical protein
LEQFKPDLDVFIETCIRGLDKCGDINIGKTNEIENSLKKSNESDTESEDKLQKQAKNQSIKFVVPTNSSTEKRETKKRPSLVDEEVEDMDMATAIKRRRSSRPTNVNKKTKQVTTEKKVKTKKGRANTMFTK